MVRLKRWWSYPWVRRILGIMTGALGGYLYYTFIGCRTGLCPLTSNPYISTLYGAVVGLLLTPGGKKEPITPPSV